MESGRWSVVAEKTLILMCYSDFGKKCVERIDGIFAIFDKIGAFEAWVECIYTGWKSRNRQVDYCKISDSIYKNSHVCHNSLW